MRRSLDSQENINGCQLKTHNTGFAFNPRRNSNDSDVSCDVNENNKAIEESSVFQPWNQTEIESQTSMESPSSPKRWTDFGVGLVCKRTSKVAKGIQTDPTGSIADTSKLVRCWRHSRGSVGNLNEVENKVGDPKCTSTPKTRVCESLIRNALPSVSLPKWTKPNKKAEAFVDLAETYFGSLYRPYASVRKQLVQQALLRCRAEGPGFEAHFLGPTALFLRTVLECEENVPPSWRRKARKRKRPAGWPLCTRGRVIVHLSELDSELLKPGDFYFLATPVGITVKCQGVRERSLDAHEFALKMASLLSPAQNGDDSDPMTHLLVSVERGVQRIEVDKVSEELWDCTRSRRKQGRSRKCTRDSWVQTPGPEEESETSRVVSAADRPQLQLLAPLASEEEFFSDNEQKQKKCTDDGFVEEGMPEKDLRSTLPTTIAQINTVCDLSDNIIESRVAFLPGSFDLCHRGIIYVALQKLNGSSLSPKDLAELMLYFQSIPKTETMCLGFLLIVDGRDSSVEDWQLLHEAISLVEGCLPGTISLVLALQKPDHQSVVSRFPTFHIKFEAITNANQLLKYVAKDQLLVDFGGTYEYDHEEWIDFHKFLDPFVANCHNSGCFIVKVIQDLRNNQLPSSLTNQMIEHQKRQILEALEDEQLQRLEKEGGSFLKKLKEYQDKFPCNMGYKESAEKTTLLYKQLKKVMQRLAKLADRRLSKLQECMMLKVFEEESSQVLAWLRRKGEETLKRHKTLADTLNAIREQENEFEKFYFLAMRQIERGNDLLEEIPRNQAALLPSGVESASVALKSQLEDFSDRLEDAREKLEDTSRCYHLLDKTYEWALETMRFVSHMKVDSSTSVDAIEAIMERLDTYLKEHPFLAEDTFSEMNELAARLKNDRLLNQCQIARTKYQETVELVNTRQDTLRQAKDQMDLEESKITLNDNYSLKSKPCVWMPVISSTAYRTASQKYLHGQNSPLYASQIITREPTGSYTSFPSSYYPIPEQKYQSSLLKQKRQDYLSKSGLLLDDLPYRSNRSSTNESFMSVCLRRGGRKSLPFVGGFNLTSVSSGSREALSDARSLKSRNSMGSISSVSMQDAEDDDWKSCEYELKQASDEVRKQNDRLQQLKLRDQLNDSVSNFKNVDGRPTSGSYSPTNCEIPATPNSHLLRCASCSDFEELLSPKSNDLELKTKNRILKLTMGELIQTERDYVKSLGYIIENYVPLLQMSNVSQALRCQRNVLFGNIEKIYEFHNCYFLNELESCESSPYSVAQCFLKYEPQFYLYALYNKNKPKSDALMAEYGNSYFKKKQQELGDKMDLASYLLKPVQRMGKYALLLKQLLKECTDRNSDYYNDLKAAEEIVCFQLRHGNDLLAMDALRECDVNVKEQGRLLRQDEFLMWQGKSRKALRHIFLFEDLILFSKARRDPECKGHDYYQYKNSFKTSDIGLTEQVGESPTKFEIWFRKRKVQDVYTVQAPSAEVKMAWVQEISKLLWKQALRNRELRLAEMSSMGIGNKPCLDITPSQDQICDRSISVQQLNKATRFRNSIAVSSSDNFNSINNNRRPSSVISLSGSSSIGSSQGSSIFYENGPLVEAQEIELDKRRSMAQQSQCSAESGIFTDLSMSGESYSETLHRMKTVERSDSNLSHASYGSIDADPPFLKETQEISTATFPSGHTV